MVEETLLAQAETTMISELLAQGLNPDSDEAQQKPVQKI